MRKVAEEIFNDPAYKDKQPLTVQVYEHAGWWLQYAMIDGEAVVVGTANDAASMSPAVRAFHDKYRHATITMLPGIRRNDLAKE